MYCTLKYSKHNDLLQKTDTFGQITWKIILQPNFSQNHDFQQLLRHIRQLTWQKEILWTCFHKKSYKIDFIRGNTHQPIETDEWKSDTLH